MPCPIGPGSPLYNEGQPIPREFVLPSLLGVRRYKRADYQRRYEGRALVVGPFPLLQGGDDPAWVLKAQKDYCRRLLRRLCMRVLPADALHDNPIAAPFTTLLAFPTEMVERRIPIPGNPGASQAIMMPAPGSLRGKCIKGVAEGEVHVCPDEDRLRARLGPRANSSSPFYGDYVARIICWVLQGPPPWPWEKGPVAAHLCGTPACVCPDHIRWLTRKQDAACRAWHEQHGRGEQFLWPGP